MDPRYTLTEEELSVVRSLKDVCLKENVKFRSIFELAKYTLVTSSIKNPEKRLQESLSRLKSKRAFEEKYKLDELNLIDCADRIQTAMPDWAIPCGKINDKQVLGYTAYSSKSSFFKEKGSFEAICKLEFSRYELAAANLEEARQGFYLLGVTKDLPENPLKFLKPVLSLRVLFTKMHANRVKGLFWEVKGLVGTFASSFSKVVPKHLKERLCVGKDFDGLMKKFSLDEEELKDKLPGVIIDGGRYEQSLVSWIKEREEQFKKSVSMVTLGEE
eukprot:maker-scaffold_4-snap-gene-17.50-mRNA-1 protein AED:0.07 eAED:0.07 QI:86/0/0.5/0.5/0/0/2/197/272